MRKIIPFKKEIMFKNTVEEIVSISMDNHLEINSSEVKGNFIISGEYECSNEKEPFNFDIPYLGHLDDNYDTQSAKVNVDDFYYEVSEPNKLSIFIDICVDGLLEKPLLDIDDIDELEEEIREDNMDNKELEEEIREDNMDNKEDILEEKREEDITQSMFSGSNEHDESYRTYKVYIAREGDTVETILEKYEISYEQLVKYNVINELTIGDKLIIPHEKNK